QEHLSQIIERLPEKAKLVFTYSRERELTISQIAKKMNLSPKAVEYHMTKALRTLRDAVKKIKSVFV
ncbi:MAG TPA: sigma factor-like helix-turn-helix DNA-binding protein, partial [Chitinophagaceae bacterium]|nr:sigma factor-like helix-turn-helix DNA-binding protein [Chitinophagaceae bacterium]